MSVKPVAGGSFLQFDYDWTYEGEEQAGLLLFGYDEENAASAAWVDSFHMSSKIMSCTGSAADGSAELSGSYAAPPGPDWGWRITIRSVSPNELHDCDAQHLSRGAGRSRGADRLHAKRVSLAAFSFGGRI